MANKITPQSSREINVNQSSINNQEEAGASESNRLSDFLTRIDEGESSGGARELSLENESSRRLIPIESKQKFVIVTSDNQKIEVEAKLLEKYSQYFQGLMQSNMQEASALKGELPKREIFSAKFLESIIGFLKTGKINLNPENIYQMIELSEYFMIESLLLKCQKYIIQNFDINVAIESMQKDQEGELHFPDEIIAGFQKIINKYFSEKITKENLSEVVKESGFQFVTKLNLGNKGLDAESAKILAQTNNIISLNLKFNDIGDDGAQYLAQNTTINVLDLSMNDISIDGVEALAQNKTITDLDLSMNQIGDVEAEIISHNDTITNLKLEFNQIETTGAIALAQNKIITNLSLKFNEIRNTGAQALAQNNTLISLDLYDNKIGDIGAGALAQNKTIKVLNLSKNRIGDDGAQELAKNTTINTLSLGMNRIEDEGAVALAKNNTLVILDLYNNAITNVGAEALAKNTTLKSLDISFNPIDEHGIDFLLRNENLTLRFNNDIER